jgi:hypothetical protein
MALVTDLQLRATVTETSALDLVTASAPMDLVHRLQLPSGTGANQADVVFSDTRTLAASGAESLDLKGSLLTPLGAAFTPAKLKAIIVTAAAGNTNSVLVSRPASNGVPWLSAAGDQVNVRPGGVLYWACTDATAIAVTADTGDLITITNSGSGTGVTYSIVLIGTSA